MQCMARAEVASASVNSDSIKGLAQSIAGPAYRRLLSAEPALRRAVPALIIAFLVTVAAVRSFRCLRHPPRPSLDAPAESDWGAGVRATGRAVRPGDPGGDPALPVQRAIERGLPQQVTQAGRLLFVTNSAGIIAAASPSATSMMNQRLADVIGRTQMMTTFGAQAGVVEVTLPDGTAALVTVRALKAPMGQLAIVQPLGDVLTRWRSNTALTFTLFATTLFVLLILGFAFHWQAKRASESDHIYDMVRSIVDTGLNRGRCGLWDWELDRGLIFWSNSMFDILGLEPKDRRLTFGYVSSLVHPDDIKLYQLAAQLFDGQATFIDRAFRMRHARGDWVWLRARCELVQQPG